MTPTPETAMRRILLTLSAGVVVAALGCGGDTAYSGPEVAPLSGKKVPPGMGPPGGPSDDGTKGPPKPPGGSDGPKGGLKPPGDR